MAQENKNTYFCRLCCFYSSTKIGKTKQHLLTHFPSRTLEWAQNFYPKFIALNPTEGEIKQYIEDQKYAVRHVRNMPPGSIFHTLYKYGKWVWKAKQKKPKIRPTFDNRSGFDYDLDGRK